MFVPEPVISLAIKPLGKETPNFSRALNRFQKEDPTFKVHLDHESKEVGFLICHPQLVFLTIPSDHYLWNGRTASRNLR
jgi:hypothetical protein